MTQNNVVLLIFDSMRKDEFDQNMIKVGQKIDSEFVRCESVGSGTLPSMGGLIYSKLPHSSRMNFYENRSLEQKNEDAFFDKLKSRETGLISTVDRGNYFGVSEWFDYKFLINKSDLFEEGINPSEYTKKFTYDSKHRYVRFLKDSLVNQHTAKSLINGFAAYVGGFIQSSLLPKLTDDGVNIAFKRLIKMVRNLKEPFFVIVHVWPPHGPYKYSIPHLYQGLTLPPTWHSRKIDKWRINNMILSSDSVGDYQSHIKLFRKAYKNDIKYLDQKLAPVINHIEKQTKAKTSFLLTGDHGKSLAFDGEF
jgi:hypothetical protein